jgi:chloramphenicol 3-O phosphotransferase
MPDVTSLSASTRHHCTGRIFLVSDVVSRGRVVILNGAPRAGKSTLAAAIQETFPGTWLNLGVDSARAMTPRALQPGIGLRPGEGDHPAAAAVPILYAALWESVAAHARLGLNVVVDVGLYDVAIAADAATRLDGISVLFVGVQCDVETILQRRRAAGSQAYAVAAEGEPVPEPVLRWQEEVHAHWTYDLEVDTSVHAPDECAAEIRKHLNEHASIGAFARLGTMR